MTRDWVRLTWREKTWGERAQTVAYNIVATTLCLIAAFLVLVVLGRALDGIDRYNVEHDRCLKNATNGYEIKQC